MSPVPPPLPGATVPEPTETSDTTGTIQVEAKPPNRAVTITRKPVPIAAVTTLEHEKPSTTPTNPPHSTLASLSRQWHHYSRRTRSIAIGVLAALLILIIGLAAGLSTRSSLQNLPLPSSHGGPYTGDLTYYATGLGACGVTSSNGDNIVAVSHILYDAVQGESSDPNSNPLCGKKIRVRRKGGDVSVDLTVVDRCTGCEAEDLDVTEDTFAELADVSLGRVVCEWAWLDAHQGPLF